MLKKEILFSHLEQEELKDLLDAMYEKKYAAGDDIITQNDENGEEFFVMAEGEVDVIIGGNKVADMKEGSFGDLALIYGTPRAATIRATKATICFAMDRSTYRAILMGSTIKRRKMFDAILEKVEMLKDIDNFERSQVADALETEHFEDGTTIIKQGDDGTIFYIIMSGECVVTQTNEAGETGEVAQLKEADYFGEIALLTSEPRKATVTAKGATKVRRARVPSVGLYFFGAAFVLLYRRHARVPRALLAAGSARDRPGGQRTRTRTRQAAHARSRAHAHAHARTQTCVHTAGVRAGARTHAHACGVLRLGNAPLTRSVPLAPLIPPLRARFSRVQVAKLDRARFERVLGPCDDILRRNMANYEKFTGSK